MVVAELTAMLGSLKVFCAATGTTLRHWGYALTTPGSYAIRVFLDGPNKARIYSNTISIQVISLSYSNH
jgi:hypothetical protein